MVDFEGQQSGIKKMLEAIPAGENFSLITAIMTLCMVINHGLHGVAEAIELQRK